MVLGFGTTRKYAYGQHGAIHHADRLGRHRFHDHLDGVHGRRGREPDAASSRWDVTDWTYDNRYQLIGQQRSGFWATFTHDSTDNILAKYHQGSIVMTMTYDPAGRRRACCRVRWATPWSMTRTGISSMKSESCRKGTMCQSSGPKHTARKTESCLISRTSST